MQYACCEFSFVHTWSASVVTIGIGGNRFQLYYMIVYMIGVVPCYCIYVLVALRLPDSELDPRFGGEVLERRLGNFFRNERSNATCPPLLLCLPYLQLKKAGPGNEAAVERLDKFPRMLQDKEKCALLRAIERCPEPDNVAVRRLLKAQLPRYRHGGALLMCLS